jgi:hypothetical protein
VVVVVVVVVVVGVVVVVVVMMMVMMMMMMMMNGFVTRFCTPSTFQSSVQTSFYIFFYEEEIS